uniref:Uncharacterized protein MANES_15G111100 n=1 Tax=Rhizophora mucronata TaxID=61149 RepID=A0A2P2M215_RHIMU
MASNSVAMFFLMVLSHLPFLLAFQSTVPAFLWSSYHYNPLQNTKMDVAVNYQTISLRDLAKSVLSEGKWSNLLCSEENLQQSLDLALVFVGREVRNFWEHCYTCNETNFHSLKTLACTEQQ